MFYPTEKDKTERHSVKGLITRLEYWVELLYYFSKPFCNPFNVSHLRNQIFVSKREIPYAANIYKMYINVNLYAMYQINLKESYKYCVYQN